MRAAAFVLLVLSCLSSATAQSLKDLQPGDLLFKPATTELWTELAAHYSTGDKRWGHVGVVSEVESEAILIIHADMGPPQTIGVVEQVALNDFLGQADHVGHFRPDLEPHVRNRFIEDLRAKAASGLPFDRGYNLTSANNAYCTELVWRAWMTAEGQDPMPNKSQSLTRPYIALSDLSQHPRIIELGRIDWSTETDDPARGGVD